MRPFFLIFAISLLLFGLRIAHPTTLDFDETHYVPAAKDLLRGIATLNLEHPPLAKYFMAIGIGVFGDDPVGWRLMSVLFGSLSVVAMVALAEALGFSLLEQWLVAILSLTNFMTFIMARLCMLDIFLLFFLLAGVAAFISYWREPRGSRTPLIFSGVSFGLALACKWSMIYTLIVPLAIASGLIFSQWTKRRDAETKRNLLWLFVGVFVLPLVVYYLSYLPLWLSTGHGIEGPLSFFKTQQQMYLTHVGTMKPHSYESQWYTWPVLYRPIWFKYENFPNQDLAQTTLFIGNPWLAWCGLLAMIYCLYDFFKTRSWVAGAIAALYFCSYLGWSLVHRQVQFLYYYLPAFMMLGLACVYSLRRWPRFRVAFVAINVLFFMYFYPVISGGPLTSESLKWWMWFNSWR